MPLEPSEESHPRGFSETACRLLAGIETGFAASVVFLSWLCFYSWLIHDFWWSRFNVAAAVFYGDTVFHMGAGRATVSGAAFLLVAYTLLGVVFARLARPRGILLNLFGGIVFILVWHVLADRIVWSRLHPFAHPYFAPVALLPGHLLYGVALSRFGPRFVRLALSLGDPSWALAYRPPAVLEEISQTPPLSPAQSPDEVTEATVEPPEAPSTPAPQRKVTHPDETPRPNGTSADC